MTDFTEEREAEGLPQGEHVQHNDTADGVIRSHDLDGDCWCDPEIIVVPVAVGSG